MLHTYLKPAFRNLIKNKTVWIILTGWTVALLVAFLTISIQAIKAAITNPVKNLRTE